MATTVVITTAITAVASPRLQRFTFPGPCSRATAAALTGVFVVTSLLLAGCAGGDRRAASTITAAPTQPTLVQVVATVRTGVVRLETSTCEGTTVGTGFLIGPRLIATVEHVVDGATAISVKQNGRLLTSGTVIGSDAEIDVALLRTDVALDGHEFKFASTSPRLGAELVVLGFPLGLPLTVTRGSVSGSNRSLTIDGVSRKHLVQTDAALNHGNSGGPLIAARDGTVLGLADLKKSSASGLGFAVSAQTAYPLLDAWSLAPAPEPLADCSLG
jgi:serine protease Do